MNIVKPAKYNYSHLRKSSFVPPISHKGAKAQKKGTEIYFPIKGGK